MLSNPSGRGLSRRRLVGLSVAAAATSPLAGLGPAHAAAASAATVTVFASGADRIIGREFVGLAYEKYALTERLFTAANTDLVGLFRSLGPGLLRIGGATVDMFIWTPGGQGRTHRQIAPADVDALAGFLRATGWRCLYGINLAGASTNATSPAMAADEVRYATGALGPSLAGIEIGNEPEFYGAGGYFPEATWTVQTYETLWRSFRDTIVHINPKVAISGPGCVSRIGDWTAPFAVAQKGRLHMVTQHYYRGNGLDGGATAANLITPDTRLPGYLDALKRAGWGAAAPVRITEGNSYYSGGAPGVSNAYASALWVIDFLFTCALGDASGVNLQGGGVSAYTPIADQADAVVEVRPCFYGLKLFQLAGRGRVLPTATRAGGRNVSAYAVAADDGSLRIVLVNKDTGQDLDVTVALPRPAGRATALSLEQRSPGASGPSLTATSGVRLQGATIGLDGRWTPDAAEVVPVAGGQLKVRLPRLSAVLVTVS